MKATVDHVRNGLPGRRLRWAAMWAAAGVVWLALGASSASWGQATPGGAPPSASQQDLLYRARLAIAQGRLDEADTLLVQAEKAGGPADPLVGRFQDTPDKVRRALAARRAAADPASPPAPSAEAGGSRYSSPPAVNTGTPAAGPERPSAPLNGANPLLQARRALARGDVAEAQRQLEFAKRSGGVAVANGDSPQAIEVLLQAYPRLAAGPPPGADPRAFQRQQADFLLAQADQLVKYGELDLAQDLARRARALPVEYQSTDRTPDALLQAIAARRRPGAPATTAAAPLSHLPAATAAAVNNKSEARRALAEARVALDRDDLVAARQLAERALQLDDAWQPAEPQPWQVLLEVNNRLRRQQPAGVAQAGYESIQTLGSDNAGNPFPVRQGVFNTAQDDSRVVAAANNQPNGAAVAGESPGHQLYAQGLAALEKQDIPAAIDLFKQAWKHEATLDPVTRQQLKDKLTLLNTAAAPPRNPAEPASPLEEIDARQQIAQQQLFREINNEQRAAEQQRLTDPKGALNRLQTLQGRVAAAEIDPATKQQFLAFVDRNIQELQAFIDQNRSAIELDERNRAVQASIDEDRQRLIESQDKIAELVEQFNTLLEEKRYADAEIVAKQAREIAPEDPAVQTLMWKSRFARSVMEDMRIKERKEDSFVLAMQSVDQSSEPFDDREPIVFGDKKKWEDITRRRMRELERADRRMSPEEQEIEKALSTKVSVNLRDVPLQEALKTLCDLAGVPLFLDPQGLAVEAVTTDQSVTIELPKEISLKSALNLILNPLRLSYVIENDVLKITSEGARDAKVYPEVYYVADLVIPIPNFVPGHNVGLPEAVRQAHASLGHYTTGAMPVPLTVSATDPASTMPSGSILAQTNAFGRLPSMKARPTRTVQDGVGAMGGVSEADFQALIDLITSTVSPDSWEVNGGNGAVEPFVANLSLVVSNTQDVHEEIAQLLDQLRRLLDLQVTIEVRFITLNDSFFERIGVDFDFNIDDNSGLNTRTPFIPDDDGNSIVVGLGPDGQPTNNLDLQFRQGSYETAIPQFGGFTPETAANFGFAILSDIEVFFLLQAAQGDSRTNVLLAPKVTLWNGQQALIQDTAQRPFVTQIIPVVADFAAAHMPVITVLSEGTSLTVQAVVSQDRRFVRLTLVPIFSEIGDVDTFTYTGRQTSDTGTNVVDADGNPVGERDNVEQSREGTTVQLPTFLSTSVSTTVNVPDGGTILLGGIKRLSEGRNEAGVPMVSKLPYLNRLFKNVGIGRETNSLMMMVTPRIIIQEEEEAKLGIPVE